MSDKIKVKILTTITEIKSYILKINGTRYFVGNMP